MDVMDGRSGRRRLPGGRRLARASVAFALLASCVVAVPARAESPSPDPCVTPAPASLDAHRDYSSLHLAFEGLVRAEPERAIALACAEADAARDAGQRTQARIDLGTALHQASRDDEAVAILDGVVAASDVDPVQRAQAQLQRGNAWVTLRDMQKAGADYAAAQAALIAARRQDDLLYAEVLMGVASARHIALDLDGADRDLDEADALLRRLALDRTRTGADLFNQRTMVAYARQDFAATIRYAEAELAVTRSIGGPDDREQLDALATLGAVKSITGDFVGAEGALREGLRIAEVRDDTAVDARLGLLQNLATFYLDRVQPDDALPYAERALSLASRQYGPDSPALMRVYLTLASVHAELARYAEARRDYERAGELDDAHGAAFPALQRARLYLRRAQLRLKLGDRDGVRADLARAGRVMGDQARLNYWRGWQGRIACRLATAEGDWPKADAQCAQAIAQFDGVLDASHPLLFDALVGRCYAQTRGRLVGYACVRVDERMRATDAANLMVRIVALEALAVRERSAGRPDAALALRIRMLAAAHEISAPDPLWAAQFAVAESLADRGDRRLAILFAKQSIAAIEDMREDFAADRERQERGFLADKLVVYRQLANWLLDEGRAPEAIAVLRLLKREELYDFTERPTARAAPDDPGARVAYTEREALLLRRLAAPTATLVTPDAERVSDEIGRLSRLRDGKKLSAEEALRLKQLLSESQRREEARTAELQRFIVDARGDATRTTTAPRSDPTTRNATLGRDEAQAYFFVADARLQLVVVHGGGIERLAIDVDPQALNRGIGDYLAAVSGRGDAERTPAAANLYAWLGAPLDRIARPHGIRRVQLWLDGALRYVPFAALWDGRGYLVERYAFSYLSAGRSAADASATRAHPHSLVAFGVTRALRGMPALPGVGVELCGIVNGRVSGLDGEPVACAASGIASGALDGVGFANEYFTESRLRTFASAAPDPVDLLHVGTHFSLRPGNMQRSWLLMGDGARLPLATFAAMDFAGLDLVTMSSCETGMAGAVSDDGREIEGLPALILQRGARTVVASLWRVDDRSAGTLMRSFYAGLKGRGVRVSDALRRAQLAMLRGATASHARPYYWAGFVPSASAP